MKKIFIVLPLFFLLISCGNNLVLIEKGASIHQLADLKEKISNNSFNKEYELSAGTDLIIQYNFDSYIKNNIDSGESKKVYIKIKDSNNLKENVSYKIPEQNIEIFKQNNFFGMSETGIAKELSGEIKIIEKNNKVFKCYLNLHKQIHKKTQQ